MDVDFPSMAKALIFAIQSGYFIFSEVKSAFLVDSLKTFVNLSRILTSSQPASQP